MTESQQLENISTKAPHATQDEHNNRGDTNLVCHWNHCLKVFPNHPSLASHLSEDHVGWKKGGYFCDWNNCARQGAKCHNRFALMMHLRIHTGEKPFECTYPNCGQTFGRMDALVRHKKAEHGEGSFDKPTKPISTPTINIASNHAIMTNHTSSTPITSTPITSTTSTNTVATAPATAKPRKQPTKKATTSLDMLSKNKRMKIRKVQQSELSSGDESDDSLADLGHRVDNKPTANNTMTTTTTTKSSQPSLLSGSADYNQYRLAKAQLHYILRENEMLQDEFELAQKKLKRMRTERRVLLDAVIASEQRQHHNDEEVEEDDSYDIIPTNEHQVA